jgi:hypothetical protein
MRCLYVLLALSMLGHRGWSQEKLPIPEFFGFYAVDNGRSFSIHEGQGTDATKLKAVEFYSYWNKGILRNDVPEVSSRARFILFYANAGEMVKDMSLHQLPLLRNSIETPELLERQMAAAQGRKANDRIVASPNKPLFAKVPELDFRLLSKPVPNQPQMVEIVPSTPLAGGLYVMDYAKGAQGREGWYAIFAVSSGEEQRPFCMDLVLQGGTGGQLFNSNSPLANSVPSLSNGQYRRCAGEAPTSIQTTGTTELSGVPGSQAACTDFDSCMRAGHSAFSSSDWTTAITDFQAASDKKPDSGEPLIWLGNADLSAGRRDDFSAAWDKAMNLGSNLTLRVCHNRSSRPCELGSLLIGSTTISFTGSDNQVLFSGAPSEISVSRRTGETRFTLRSGNKNYGFEFAPFAMECQPMEWLMCSDDPGIRQQQAVGAYILQTIPRLTNGSLGNAAARR